MIFYTAGILAGAFLPELPQGWLWLAAAPLLLFGPWHRQGTAFWLGLLLAISYGHWQLWHRLDPQTQGRDHHLTGIVSGLPTETGGVQRFELKVLDAGGSRVRRVRLGWYDGTDRLRPGDRVRLRARLKPPRGLWNPAAFDYERWALARGIDATGYVRGELVRLNAAPGVDRLRAALAARLDAGFADAAVAALARALLLGDRRGLEEPDWRRLRRTGTVHLLVVSGLHIGIILGVGWLLGRGLCWLCPNRWLGGLGSRLLPVVLALLFSGGYVLLAGAGLATQRAWIMAAALLLSAFWLWPLSAWRRWWLALALVLTLQPLAVLDAGLWLSFGAVAVLLLLAGERGRQPLWRRLLRAQLAIFCLMAPLLLGVFGELSLIGPVINLVAIPLLPLLILALGPLLLALWAGIAWPVIGYEWLVGWLWSGLGALASWPGAALSLAMPHGLLLALALLAAAVLTLPLSYPVRLLTLSIWGLALFAVPPVKGERGGLRAWVFDVGQGTAVLVESDGRRLLYDTGPGYLSGSTALERSVLPLLRRDGVRRLERLVVSHADNDHAGGRRYLLRRLNVVRRQSGSARLQAREGYDACRAGERWRWGDTQFHYLHGGGGGDENDSSCVLLIESEGCRLLLTGDIGAGVERGLVAAGLPTVTWLLASHHGSRSSSTETFVAATRPEAVLFSAGYLNPYGHPAPEVVRRFEREGSRLLTTAHTGAIELTVEDGECRARTWRQARKRYWSGW
ncbi:DNA internalization-related competence protein ComEC/Rec2 [Marinobacterium nitratireducens]|uniref:DNA internalization-related competence protein ComEC/Rec2 n=1 Tax=Marinobacterium nitratireducens TaxID=518897 RepID=A0A917ZCL8_9GAMM|nr:DNA internalization-related competence protein ComEC/Rec2 [Marinobacterium nitratireducens]GGO80378.1 DNA internalization-related competence protein ComEC/Rec2 [Marinobacterium nitratireducens]